MINNYLTIREMQADYRPDEKFIRFGSGSLTCAELLAIILRTGSTGEPSVELTRKILYNESSGLEDIQNIFNYDLQTLMKIRGVGKVKALQIKAVAELSKRIAQSRSTLIELTDAHLIAERYMEEMRHRKKESVLLLLLNSACKLIKEIYISEGTVNASLFSPREIFLEALKYEAVSIIVLHNHPSGLARPSEADISATKSILKAGRLIGIQLLDHIIIGDGEYVSFREKGLINE